jgi:hypothetical protein
MKTEELPSNSAPQKIIFFSVREFTPGLRFFSVAREGRREEGRMSAFAAGVLLLILPSA